MKARVKATGEIVEISEDCSYVYAEHFDKSYNINELEFLDVKEKSFPKDDPDYWTRLEHQAAIAAMQGLMTILPNIGGLKGRTPRDEIVDIATSTSHALVQKLKEKEERK